MKRAAFCCFLLCLAALLLPAATGYLMHNLVADVAGAADFTDPNMVNAWGIATNGIGPLWVCNGGTGTSTVYTASASTFAVGSLVVKIPPSAASGNTVCTGIVGGVGSNFQVQGKDAGFIFATEGGTISAWAAAVNRTEAQMMVDNSMSGAVYKGLAVITTGTPELYAANFHSGTIDVFDTNYKPVTLAAGAFTDPAIPAGFAPFNIQNLNGKLYVTYAKQDSNKYFNVPGAGLGYVDVYDPTGKLLQHLAAQGPLNSPWGVQIAPADFGKFGGELLVGNFGDGTINEFDLNTGASLGPLQDQTGKTITIPFLWGLLFGNGASGGDPNSLYFTAGPSAQKHGLLGIIVANPEITSNIVNAATPGAEIGPNTFVSIIGGSMAPTTRPWATADFKGNNLPTSLDGVSVTVNDSPAYVSFVSPRQINVLTPANMPSSGNVTFMLSDNGLTSDAISLPVSAYAPAFFMLGKYAVAQHANFTIVGPATLVANNSTPAKPGETIILYATGLGPTNPAIPNGQIVSTPAITASNAMVLIGGVAANVTFAGLVGPGVYQINLTVPSTAASGDNPIAVQIGGYSSPGNVFISVQ